MVQEIIETITSWLAGFWTLVSTTIESAVSLFWDAETSKLTVIGVLGLFGLAVGLVYLGLMFVMRLFKK